MTRRVLFCLAAAALVLPACAPLSKSIPVSPQGKAVPKVETPLSGPTRIASPRAYAHYLRANAYRFQGQLDLAMAEMEKAVAADPGSALLLSHAASLYLQNGRLAEAAQASELALATKPELLLLDEFMAGLNPIEVGQAMDLVKATHARGITIFMIEHVMKAIMNVCDRIMVLHHGEKIAEGTPEKIASSKKVVEIYLGEEVNA